MRKLFTRPFRRRYPICGTAVPGSSEGAVRCCGQWCCSQSHAEAYACRLYEDLADFQYRHAARHRVYVPRLMVSTMGVAVSGASGWDKSGRAIVAPASPHAASLVACSTWEITETFFPP
jgi:hypothetical protein